MSAANVVTVSTTAPTINELEAALIDEFRAYLLADIVETVFWYTSTDNFIELVEGLAAFLNVPVEEAANYLLPVCKVAVAAIEQSANSALAHNLEAPEAHRICAHGHKQLPVYSDSTVRIGAATEVPDDAA